MAAYRTLELTLISAKDLKNVNFFSRMDVYAVVSLSSDPRHKQRTPADRDGGRNPNWNFPIRTTVPASDNGQGHIIHILLRSHRVLGDRDVGEVRVPLRELLDPSAGTGSGGGPNCPKFLSYQVRRISSGKAKGVLTFSYKLGDINETLTLPMKLSDVGTTERSIQTPGSPITAYPAAYPPPEMSAKGYEPVTAYPVAGGYGGGYATPTPYPYGAAPPPMAYPPPMGYSIYGYNGAAPPGYGYAPAGYGYGPQPQARKVNFGMGMGAGIIGGAIGGMMIGDMISDAAAYGAGYNAGFDDVGGFDY